MYENKNGLFLLREIIDEDLDFKEDKGLVWVNTKIICKKRKNTPIILFKISKISSEALFLYLEFKYENHTYKASDASVNLGEKRELLFESSFTKLLCEKYALVKITKNLFRSDFKNLEEILKTYQNIELLYKDDKVFKRAFIPSFKRVDIKESREWISYDLSYDFAGDEKDLLSQLDLYKKGWSISYKDKLFLLPPKLKSSLEEIKQNKLELKIPWYEKGVLRNFLKNYDYKLKELCPYKDVKITQDKLKTILKEYQKIGVKWLKYLYKNELNGCLADEMGLGKTLQVLTFLNEKDVKVANILIICPRILIKNWKNEIEKFGFDFNTILINSSKNLKEVETKLSKIRKNILITSFGIIKNTELPLKNLDFLIIDEAQNIKNILTAANKSVNALNPKHKLLLTGTPLENNTDELLALFEFLNPRLLKRLKNTTSLKELIKPFLLRRTKNEVLSLPKKVIYNDFLEMFEDEKTLYTSLVKKYKKELSEQNRYKIKDGSLFLKMLMILRQLCCHPLLLSSSLNPNFISKSAKFEKLKLIIKAAKKQDKKLIIFSQFTKMLGIIKKELEEKNIKNYYLDGKSKDKNELIKLYENDPSFSVFLISLKVGGVGITLTSAKEVVIYDPWWNPAVENQAIDRVHRIGQQESVDVHYLYAKGSIEEKIYKLKNEKNELFLELLDSQDEVVKLLF